VQTEAAKRRHPLRGTILALSRTLSKLDKFLKRSCSAVPSERSADYARRCDFDIFFSFSCKSAPVYTFI
jgi:hypothetical protein